MRVAELWRFPVKSLQGEQLDDVTIGPHGIVGDRGYALFDADTGFGLTARRAPELLFASGRLRDDGSAAITLPDGSIADDDEALSSWLGRSVLLRSTSDDVTRRYENPVDPEHEELSRWEPFDGAHGAFHDEPGASISLVSSTTIAGWQTRRFRTNVVLGGEGVPDDTETSLLGLRVAVGDARLDVGMEMGRCVMVTRPQAGGIDRDLDVLRAIHRGRHGRLGVGATVARQGRVRVGDEIRTATPATPATP